MSYKKVKEIAKEVGCSIKDLLALSPNRDPFYAGGKSSRERAKWFADIWQKECFESGIHLRRIHYRLVSKEGAVKADGTPYENNQTSWSYLLEAACQARYLGLVEAGLMVDMRNPGPVINALPADNREPACAYDEFYWELPHVNISLSEGGDWEMPVIYPCNYWYEPNLQPYLLEIWVEKTTMNDVLEPLCREFYANLVAGAGFLSVTSVVSFLKRVETIGKPCRIFYISDFDPAGSYMPFAISRQIEYWQSYYNIECDIKLKQVALTQEQVERYRLPSIPIKESDTRKGSFKKTFGQDATELDALEANLPGELEKILRKELLKYFDPDFANSMKAAEERAIGAIQEWEEEHLVQYEDELRKLNEQKWFIVQKYEEQLRRIQEECKREFAPFEEPVNRLRQAVINEINSYSIDLPPLPEPNIAEDTEDDVWIYDSSRNYLEQLKVYKALMPNGKGVDRE